MGAVGNVRVAPGLWQKWVLSGLCRWYQEWESEREPKLSKGRGVKEILEAIQRAGGLKATRDKQATGRAVVIPQNSEKCSMILVCKEQNQASGVKPKGFRLPQMEKICDRLVFDNKKSAWRMCKLDLGSCLWRIRPPAQWRHSFEVRAGGGGGDRWTRLPFGWAFSPVVCQKLVSRIMSGVLARLQTEGFVYLDDILLVATKLKVRRGSRCVAKKLRKAGFLINPKSVCERTHRLTSLGSGLTHRREKWETDRDYWLESWVCGY